MRQSLASRLFVPLLAILAASVALGCELIGKASPSIEPALFPLAISVRSEGGSGVAGVELWSGERRLATSDASGVARMTVPGAEGEALRLTVKCPSGYASPERPLLVGLRHLGNGSTSARFETECFRLVHSVVVGVRAENGAHLPILHLKSVVGQTDETGVAHVLLEASANEQIALTLDTSRDASLLPQNPTLNFLTRESDELVLVSQKFTVKRAPPKRQAARAIPQHL